MQLVQVHLPSKRKEFYTYFTHFNISEEVRSLSDGMQKHFWNFVNDSTARYAFEALPLTKFPSKMSELYPSVTKEPMRALLMFPSTYLCEQGFSAMFSIKT